MRKQRLYRDKCFGQDPSGSARSEPGSWTLDAVLAKPWLDAHAACTLTTSFSTTSSDLSSNPPHLPRNSQLTSFPTWHWKTYSHQMQSCSISHYQTSPLMSVDFPHAQREGVPLFLLKPTPSSQCSQNLTAQPAPVYCTEALFTLYWILPISLKHAHVFHLSGENKTLSLLISLFRSQPTFSFPFQPPSDTCPSSKSCCSPPTHSFLPWNDPGWGHQWFPWC